MEHKPLPSEARLRELFIYQPRTGLLFWKISPTNKVPVGSVAGTRMNAGYIHVQVDGVLYLAHRLVWLLTRHEDPGVAQIDHKNRVRSDNRSANLRLAPRCEFDNMQNQGKRRDCVSGIPGVAWDRFKKRWRAYVGVDKKVKHLGYFTRKADAVKARRTAKATHHGYNP